MTLSESPSSNYVSGKPHICNNNTMHSVNKPRKNILELEVLTDDIFIEEDVLNVSTDGSKIVDFYKDKCVFVTGASGFLGKILVEKLLRACEDLQTIYILIRDKKGKDIHTRMDEIYNDVIFNQLAKRQPKFRHKIVGIKGDISLPGLGICESDRELLKLKVNVIFHVAATVRFDEKIKTAVAINVKGTKDVLQLGKECINLESFVHVSTAFANCVYKEIDEKFFKSPFTTSEIISIVDTIPEKILDEITPRLIGDHPNTYAFTKAIAEQTVTEYGKGLPICVFRPAIVMATYREPIRSWIDNLYGPTGVLVGAGTGVLRTLHGDISKTAEIVPVDYVVNSMIAASYNTYVKKNPQVPVYNYVSSVEKRVTWGDVMYNGQYYGLPFPATRSIWYYSFTLNKYKFVHLILTVLLHWLPGLLMDTALVISGKSPMMLKLYKKVNKFTFVLSYFTTNSWKFTNHNVQALWEETSDADKRVFPFSMKDFDWDYYFQTQMLGLRTFIVKDDLSSLPQARTKWRRLKYAHCTLKYLMIFLVLRLLYGVLSHIY